MIIEENGSTTFLTTEGQEHMIKVEKNLKYRMLWIMLFDAGLRISEALSLTWKDLNFQNRFLTVKTLKQQGKDKHRKLYISQRLFDAISDYWTTLKKRPDESDFVFASPYKLKKKAISQQIVDRKIKKINKKLHPHLLRHTFAVKQAASGTNLETNALLLGHTPKTCFEFYYRLPQDKIQEAIMRVENPKSRFQLLTQWTRELIIPKRKVHIQPVSRGQTAFHVGRKIEMLQIVESISKRQNVLIIGNQGLGKTQLSKDLRVVLQESTSKQWYNYDMNIVKKYNSAKLTMLWLNNNKKFMKYKCPCKCTRYC
jgi:ATP-dependent Clp protease ATP-binding subunit ClpA